MPVDDFLATAALPDVAVDAEDALARTRVRGARRRRRRSSLAGLAVACVAVTGAAAVVRHAGGGEEQDEVATGPDVSVTTPAPPSAPEPGDPATWRIDPGALPSPTASTFTVLVTRIDCHSGETGRVLRPGLALDEEKIVVTFTVEAETGGGDFTCQGNEEVAQEVDVGGPIGDRALVDGSCLPGGAADGLTSTCDAGDGIRWQPPEPPLRTVSGTLEMTGGPSGTEPIPVGGTIHAFDRRERPVAIATADAAGRFTLELPVGTYQLIGYSPSYRGGEWECTTTDPVAVADVDLEGLTVDCSMR